MHYEEENIDSVEATHCNKRDALEKGSYDRFGKMMNIQFSGLSYEVQGGILKKSKSRKWFRDEKKIKKNIF